VPPRQTQDHLRRRPQGRQGHPHLMEVGRRKPVSLILHMATLQLLKNLCRLDLELVLGQILRPLAHPL